MMAMYVDDTRMAVLFVVLLRLRLSSVISHPKMRLACEQYRNVSKVKGYAGTR